MPRSIPTSAELAATKRNGVYGVGDGLYLQVRRDGASRTWVLRFRLRGKTHWMGLGRYEDFTLAKAKRRASAQRELLADKVNPIEVRRRERAQEAMLTFGESSERYAEAHKASWSSKKHADMFVAQLKLHAASIWSRPVDTVDANDVTRILEALWSTKPTTAGKLRSRIERVLDWATNAGLRSGTNPAAWRGGLEHRLPPLGRIQQVVHRKAVAYAEAPKVYAALKANSRVTSLALRFIILTGVRSDAGRGARWEEVEGLDGDNPIWTVPVERSKGEGLKRRPHRVPLSTEAAALLKSVAGRRTGLIFAGQSPGKPISDVAVRSLLRDVGPKDADVHGWRGTLKTWASEATDFPREVVETALAHVVGSDVERAYLHGDLLEKRKLLMQAWANYLATPSSTAT